MGFFEIYSTEAKKGHTFEAELQTHTCNAFICKILGVWKLDGIIETELLRSELVFFSQML